MKTLKSIKATKVMGCPGNFGVVGEAVVIDDGREIFLTYYNYDMEVYSVSDHSLYGFLAEDGPAPEEEPRYEYSSLEEAEQESKYGAAFALLADAVGMFRKEI